MSKERQSNAVRNKEVRRGLEPSKRSRTHPWPACSSTRLFHFDGPIGWNKEPSDASLTNPETVKRRHPQGGTGWPDQPACVVYTWPPPARYGSEGGCSRLTSSRIVFVTVHRRPLDSPASCRYRMSVPTSPAAFTTGCHDKWCVSRLAGPYSLCFACGTSANAFDALCTSDDPLHGDDAAPLVVYKFRRLYRDIKGRNHLRSDSTHLHQASQSPPAAPSPADHFSAPT